MSQMRTRCVTQAGQVSDIVAEHKGNWLSASLISADTTRISLALEKIYSGLSNNLFLVCLLLLDFFPPQYFYYTFTTHLKTRQIINMTKCF